MMSMQGSSAKYIHRVFMLFYFIILYPLCSIKFSIGVFVLSGVLFAAEYKSMRNLKISSCCFHSIFLFSLVLFHLMFLFLFSSKIYCYYFRGCRLSRLYRFCLFDFSSCWKFCFKIFNFFLFFFCFDFLVGNNFIAH